MAKRTKGLEARVREASRLPVVTAFGGREYVRGVWRPIPEEQAGSAAAHPFLEVRAAGEGVVEEAVDAVDRVDAENSVDAVDVVDESPAPKTGAAPPAPVKGKKRGQL